MLLSNKPIPDFLQLLLDLLGSAVEVAADVVLLLVGQLVEHLAQLPVDHRPAGGVVGTEHHVLPPSGLRQQVLHVELQVSEEVHILPRFEGAQRVYSPVDGRVEKDLAARGRQGCLFDGRDHFSHEEVAGLLHLEGRPVQVPVLPPELIRVGVVLEVFLRV